MLHTNSYRVVKQHLHTRITKYSTAAADELTASIRIVRQFQPVTFAFKLKVSILGSASGDAATHKLEAQIQNTNSKQNEQKLRKNKSA